MPESVAWLASRGRIEDARKVADKTGMPSRGARPGDRRADQRDRIRPQQAAEPATPDCSTGELAPTILFGLASVATLILVYSLNTWLPELMLRAGFDTKGSLSFLLVLNGGAIVGALLGSRVADRLGPKVVTARSCSWGGFRRGTHPRGPLGSSWCLSRWPGSAPAAPKSSCWIRRELLPHQRQGGGDGLVAGFGRGRCGRPHGRRDALGAGLEPSSKCSLVLAGVAVLVWCSCCSCRSETARKSDPWCPINQRSEGTSS